MLTMLMQLALESGGKGPEIDCTDFPGRMRVTRYAVPPKPGFRGQAPVAQHDLDLPSELGVDIALPAFHPIA